MIQPRIQLLGVDEALAAGALLTASHANYPAFRMVFPDSTVRSRVLLPFQTAAARDAARYGRLVGALLEDRLAGVALWQPPGRFPLSFMRKVRMAPGLLRAARAAGRALTRFTSSGAALEQAFPSEPIWYLQALGVPPSARRRGVGAALLRDGLALADADMRVVICTRRTQQMFSTTSVGASNSRNLLSQREPADRRTTG